jgi:hypothetical protein
MAVLHFVDRAHRLVVSTFSGEVTRDQLEAACTRLRADRDFRPDFRQLADLSRVSRLKLILEDLNSIRSTYDPFSPNSRRAFFAPDQETLGTVKTYQTVVKSDQFEVFPSLLEAISWLNLEVTVLQAASMKSSFRPDPEKMKDSLTFDLSPNTPPTFQPMRRRLKKAQSNHH